MSLLVLTEFAAEHGVSAEQCLEGTGLRPQQLLEPGLEVTARHDLVVSRNLLALLSDQPVRPGLEVGPRYHLTTYGIWGFALASSPSLRAAIDVGLRFFDLTFSLGKISARACSGSGLELVFDAPDVPPNMRRFFIERDAAAVMTIQRELLSRASTPRRVEFAFPAPSEGAEHYREIFDVTPTFDMRETVLEFDAEDLDRPLPQSNPITTAMSVEQCRELLDKRRARTGVSGRVRDLLVAELSNAPSAEQVAADMHISSRTLRKRLAVEGTSFRGLLDEVREHVAEELLLTARLPVEHVAYRLGYLEVSSFSQAFRRWKGVSPREFRAAHEAGRRRTASVRL